MARSLAAIERRHSRHLLQIIERQQERARQLAYEQRQAFASSVLLTVGDHIGNSMQAAFADAASEWYRSH